MDVGLIPRAPQGFRPVHIHSAPPVGLGSVFIIDPLYTLPLLAAASFAALPRAGAVRGARVCAAALAVSSAYLAAAIVIQQHVRSTVVAAAHDC